MAKRLDFGYNKGVTMDEIRRKLALIEAQLSGRSVHTRLIDTAGLSFPAIGLVAGIVAQHALTAQVGEAVPSVPLRLGIVLPVLLSAVLCLAMLRTHSRLRPAIAAWGATLCFAGLGAIRLIACTTAPADDIRRFVGEDRVLATVHGRILTEPAPVRDDWCFAELTFTDSPTVFYLKLDRIKTAGGWIDAGGVVRVQVDEPTPNLHPGDTVSAYCWLYRFDGPTNPGQFDLAAHLARRNIYVGASVPSNEAIERQKNARQGLLRLVHARFRRAVAEALLPGPAAVDDPHGLAAALLLGERSGIDRRTYEAFRRTGLLHFISLSGMHLGIFAGLVWWVGKAAGLMKPGRAILCIVATTAFLLAVPARAPTVRAAVIVWAFCVAILVRRRTNALNSLCLAAMILLLIRPTQVFEAGWQLSFAAVAGILALTGPVERFIHALTHNWFHWQDLSAGLPTYAVKRIGGSAIRLFSAGVGAWIGGAGILLYHFWAITPLAVFWTVLVFPLVAAILILGFLKIVLFFLLPTVAAALGALLTLSTGLLVRIVMLLSCLDANTVLIGRVTAGVIVAYYGLVLFARFGRMRRPYLKHGLCAAMAVLLVVWIGAIKWSRTHRDHLEVTCLDVGHGQAIVVQLPGAKTVLFDAGSMYNRDTGSRIVLPFMNSRGMASLEAIVISHSDIDHVNGIPEVVAGCAVRHVYACESFFMPTQADLTAALLIESLREGGRRIEPLPRLLQIGQTRIRTLWPPEDPSYTCNLSDNDRSLVSLIEFSGVNVLLCSDIEAPAQQQLLVRYPSLAPDVVIVPHHGSATTLDETFLQRLGPDVQICSCDRKQYTRRNHPAEEEDVGKLSTARNGAITVCVESDGMVSTTVHVHP